MEDEGGKTTGGGGTHKRRCVAELKFQSIGESLNLTRIWKGGGT